MRSDLPYICARGRPDCPGSREATRCTGCDKYYVSQASIERKEMKTLHVTVGLPRAGKSTWARRQGWPIVEGDAVRKALGVFPFKKVAEPMVWAIQRYMVRALFHAGHNNVILDSTSHTRERREKWDPEGEPWDRVRHQVFSTPAEVCISRAHRTGQEYLIPVIKKMAQEAEWPDAT